MQKNVFILGELNVDIILKGKDVVPEWNREKLLDSFDIVLGSSSAITASGFAWYFSCGLDSHSPVTPKA